MDRFTFENQGANTYIVYPISNKDEIDNLSLGMITNNKIKGIIPMSFTQMDEEKFFKYNITSKVNLTNFFVGVVNRHRLLNVFSSIVTSILSAEEYMIDTTTLKLNKDYIYVDVSTAEAELLCLPLIEETTSVDLCTFFKNIVFSTQFDQNENCDYVAKIISYLNGTNNLMLEDFKKLINSILFESGLRQGNYNTVNQNRASVNTQAVNQVPNSQQQPVRQPMSSTPMEQPMRPPVMQNQTSTGFPIPMNQPGPGYPIPVTQQVKGKKVKEKLIKEKKIKEKPIKEKPIKEKPIKEKRGLFGRKKENIPAMPYPQSPMPNKQMYAVPGMEQKIQPRPIAPPIQMNTPSMQMNTPSMQMNIPSMQGNESGIQQMSMQGQSFGETTVLGNMGSGDTTLLGLEADSPSNNKPYLVRQKNHEKIYLNKAIFRIGKEKSFVDYFVSDNPAVSRSHVNIITRGSECFILDTNSKNHTFINGNMIQPNVEVLLSHGIKIRVANEEFDFLTY